MVRQYVENFYNKAAARGIIDGGDMARAKELAGWKRKNPGAYRKWRIESVSDNIGANWQHRLASRKDSTRRGHRGHWTIAARRTLPWSLYYGTLEDEADRQRQGAAMVKAEGDDHRVKYSVQMPCQTSGMSGHTVRGCPPRLDGRPARLAWSAGLKRPEGRTAKSEGRRRTAKSETTVSSLSSSFSIVKLSVSIVQFCKAGA